MRMIRIWRFGCAFGRLVAYHGAFLRHGHEHGTGGRSNLLWGIHRPCPLHRLPFSILPHRRDSSIYRTPLAWCASDDGYCGRALPRAEERCPSQDRHAPEIHRVEASAACTCSWLQAILLARCFRARTVLGSETKGGYPEERVQSSVLWPVFLRAVCYGFWKVGSSRLDQAKCWILTGFTFLHLPLDAEDGGRCEIQTYMPRR